MWCAQGLKDVSLVSQTAAASSVPMPFCSVLKDRYHSIPVNNYECIASLSLCSLCVYVCLYVLCKDNNGRGRYLSAQAAGWSELDWSSIGMKVSTDAGADISDDLARNLKGL